MQILDIRCQTKQTQENKRDSKQPVRKQNDKTTKSGARLRKTQENKRDSKQPIGKQHADNQSEEEFHREFHYSDVKV